MLKLFESKRAWLRRQLAASERVAAASAYDLVRVTDCDGDAVSQLLAFGKKCGDAMVERERLACMTAATMRSTKMDDVLRVLTDLVALRTGAPA